MIEKARLGGDDRSDRLQQGRNGKPSGDRDVVAGVVAHIEAQPDVTRPSGDVDDVVQIGLAEAKRNVLFGSDVTAVQAPVPVLDVGVDEPVTDIAPVRADGYRRLAGLDREAILSMALSVGMPSKSLSMRTSSGSTPKSL